MSEPPTGIVRLQKDNIELRQKCDEYETLIDLLRQRVTQGTVHVYKEAGKGPSSLEELLGVKAGSGPTLPAGVVDAKEYDELEKEFEELQEKHLAVVKELDNLKNSPVLPAAGSPDDKKALRRLERDLDDARAKNTKLNAALGELNDQLSSMQEGKTSSPTSKGGAESSEVEELVQQRVEEQIFLSEQRMEEAMTTMAIDMQTTIDQQKEELEKLQKDLANEKKLHRASALPSSTGSDHVNDQAVAERNIAVHLRDVALQDVAMSRTEIQKQSLEIAKLKGQLAAGETGAGKHSHRDPMDGDAASITDLERRLHSSLALIKEKETIIEMSQELRSELELKVLVADEEAEKQVIEAVAKCDAENKLIMEDVISERDALEAELAELRAEVSRMRLDQQNALQMGKKALQDRNKALNDLTEAKKNQWERDQQRKLQIRTNEHDAELVQKCFHEANATVQTFVTKLESAESSEEISEALYTILFDYERRIWNLVNETKSLSMIVSLKEGDANAEFTNKLAAKDEEIETLCAELKRTRDDLQKMLEKFGHWSRPGVDAVAVGSPQPGAGSPQPSAASPSPSGANSHSSPHGANHHSSPPAAAPPPPWAA